MSTSDVPPSQPPRKLLLLDGHSLAYRAFFALPVENFSTSTGQPTNAVYGFTSMLINVLRDEKPTHIIVAFDVSRTSFRTERYAEYKAGRSATPTDFQGQVALVKEVLEALRVPVVEAPGYEADDAIATLARAARAEGLEVLICSGDRDAFQLVEDKITVLYPRKGVSDLARMTPAAVEERYGVGPERYRDLAALVGESSDNLPGIAGVGPKTAAKWIVQFDGLDGVVANVDQIKGKAGDALRAGLADVLRNYELNRLVDDLDLPIAPADAVWRGWDREAVHQVFDTLQFRVLRDRLYQYLDAVEPEAEGGFDLDTTVLKPGQAAGWLAKNVVPGEPVGVAVTGTFGRGAGNLTGVALATSTGHAAWLDPRDLDESDERAFADWWSDPKRPKIIHRAKEAMLAAETRGWTLRGLSRDTEIAAYLARPDQRSYDLIDLALRYLHRELKVDAPDNGQMMLDGLGDTDSDAERNLMLRAAATLDLADAIGAELARDGDASANLLRDVELPLLSVLAGMERTGIRADTDYLLDLQKDFGAQVQAVADAAHQVIGRPFNLGSPKQLQEILFDELRLPKTKKIKSGYTTDADALTWLFEQTKPKEPAAVVEADAEDDDFDEIEDEERAERFRKANELLAHLLRHREVARLKSTVDSLDSSVSADGRIHTTFFQTVAATGRLSSVDPNLQNIPIRTPEGRRIRKAFIASDGFDSLLTADYSQIEMRIMAHLSGDAALIEAFNSGFDFHSATASSVFGVATTEITHDQRRKIKAMNYGLAYGLSAYGLSNQLGITPAEATVLMEEYFTRFGGVRDYLRDVVKQATIDGYTSTVLGRRRYLPDLASDNRQRREMAERMALNAPIQGSAADIMKIAMLRVDEALRRQGLASRMLLQVHDELVFDVAHGEREPLEALLREEMGNAYPLTVPLSVSVGAGKDWDAADH